MIDDPRFQLVFEATVRGEPHGKGSVRVVDLPSSSSAPAKKKGVPNKKSDAYEKCAAQLFQLLWRGPRLRGLVALEIVSVKGRPAKPHEASLPFVEGEPEGRLYCPVTPDWDNVGKSIGDALKKGRVLEDDARVCVGKVTTLYGAVGELPHVRVKVYAVRT